MARWYPRSTPSPRAGRREPESIATRTPSTQREKTQVDRTLQLIRSTGCKSGLVFNPATPLDILKYVMDKVDIILLMSVNPGFGGQAFIPATLDKAREARKMIDESGYDIRLEIDGGVSGANIKEVAEAGVDMFVAGSAIFRDPRTEEAYKKTIDGMRADIGFGETLADEKIGKLSIVGVGMRSHSGVAAKMFDVLANTGVNIQMISTSEIKISVVIDLDQAEEATQAVHDAFLG